MVNTLADNDDGNVIAITLKVSANDKLMLDDAISKANLSQSAYIRGILRVYLLDSIPLTPFNQVSKIEQEILKLKNLLKNDKL